MFGRVVFWPARYCNGFFWSSPSSAFPTCSRYLCYSIHSCNGFSMSFSLYVSRCIFNSCCIRELSSCFKGASFGGRIFKNNHCWSRLIISFVTALQIHHHHIARISAQLRCRFACPLRSQFLQMFFRPQDISLRALSLDNRTAAVSWTGSEGFLMSTVPLCCLILPSSSGRKQVQRILVL